jgi:hypothetical protein
MKKLVVVIVLLCTAHAYAGMFNHVIKPAGKAVAGATVTASKAVAGKSKKAAQASKSAAESSKKAVKKAVV